MEEQKKTDGKETKPLTDLEKKLLESKISGKEKALLDKKPINK